MIKVFRYDRGNLKGKAERTPEGYIRAMAIVTRTGVFLYQNSDGTTRRELRHPDDVFATDSLETLKMIPITIDHPKEKLVTAETAQKLSKGTTGENIQIDGEHVLTTLTITHKDAVDAAEMGKKELSLGYNLELEKIEGEYNNERYDHRQRNIRYNHLAMVDRARAGGAACLNLDAGDALQVVEANETKTKTEQTMKKVTLDGIDYDAAPEVSNALDKANARADSSAKSLDEIKGKLKIAEDAKSKLQAEHDILKETAEKSTNKDSIQKAVKARIDLERVAEKVLNADDAKDLANMDDAKIKAAVIAEKFPNANLDGKDEVYIQARFDAVVELIEDDKTAGDQKKELGEKRGDSDKKGLDSKQEDAFAAMKNMHKSKKNEEK